MSPEQRERLRAVLSSFDEVGLVALANKGLVRRAVKDLQSSTLAVEETDDALIVRGPDFTVTMPPEGPGKASDNTKATGVTRQILMAAIFLRDGWAAASVAECAPSAQPVATENQEAALLEISHEQLQKWAGKNVWREALVLVEAKPRLEVEVHAGLSIRFIDHEIEARIPPGANLTHAAKLLDNILTTASKTSHVRWVVATVLALQQHRGQSIERPESAVLADTTNAPRTRAEILDALRRLLETMVTTGLAHPSERLFERLLTLSMSALGVRLPRLGRLLRAIADEVTLLLTRDAKADTSRLFDRLCYTFALTEATVRAGTGIPLDLAGRPRTEYEPVGDLTLVGLAAFPWQTASGFHGLTLLLWDEQARDVRSWSTSRSLSTPGRFDLRQAYETDAVWSGFAADVLCRSRFVLRAARVNGQGRLSAAQGISVGPCDPAVPHQIDFGAVGFRSWVDLGAHARRVFPLGLRETRPLDSFVILFPTTWGPCVFDEIHQRLFWTISDDQKRNLYLTLPWAPVHENAIAFLEQVKPDRDRLVAVVARLAFDASGMHVEPITLWSEGTPAREYVLNPAFDMRRIQSKHSTLLDRLREKYGRNVLATSMRTEEEEPDWLAPLAPLTSELEKRFGELESQLLTWAERGIRRTNDVDAEKLRVLVHQFSQAGLDWLARNLTILESGGVALLWLGYLLRTYRQAQLCEQSSNEIGCSTRL